MPASVIVSRCSSSDVYHPFVLFIENPGQKHCTRTLHPYHDPNTLSHFSPELLVFMRRPSRKTIKSQTTLPSYLPMTTMQCKSSIELDNTTASPMTQSCHPAKSARRRSAAYLVIRHLWRSQLAPCQSFALQPSRGLSRKNTCGTLGSSSIIIMVPSTLKSTGFVR